MNVNETIAKLGLIGHYAQTLDAIIKLKEF